MCIQLSFQSASSPQLAPMIFFPLIKKCHSLQWCTYFPAGGEKEGAGSMAGQGQVLPRQVRCAGAARAHCRGEAGGGGSPEGPAGNR